MGLMSTEPEVSVVIPVYGCCASLAELVSRLVAVLSANHGPYEIILVDDGSPDDSWAEIERLSQADPRVIALRLSRNFGQHAAIVAGLEYSTGHKVVVMDCDLQDPPEMVPELLGHATTNLVVTTSRLGSYQSWIRRWLARLYARLIHLFSGIPVDPSEGSFSVLDRQVVNAFLRLKERNGHYLMFVRWLGFSHVTVPYLRSERTESKSGYSLRNQLRHGLDGLMFQSTRVLHLIIAIGLMIAMAGVAFAGYVIYRQITGQVLSGWTSLVTIVTVLAGSIIAIQGVIGVYVSHMFLEVKRRPRYIVEQEIGGQRGHRRMVGQEVNDIGDQAS